MGAARSRARSLLCCTIFRGFFMLAVAERSEGENILQTMAALSPCTPTTLGSPSGLKIGSQPSLLAEKVVLCHDCHLNPT